MQFNAKIENLFLIPSDNNRVSYMILHVRNLKSNSSYWQNISISYWYVERISIFIDANRKQASYLVNFRFLLQKIMNVNDSRCIGYEYCLNKP